MYAVSVWVTPRHSNLTTHAHMVLAAMDGIAKFVTEIRGSRWILLLLMWRVPNPKLELVEMSCYLCSCLLSQLPVFTDIRAVGPPT